MVSVYCRNLVRLMLILALAGLLSLVFPSRIVSSQADAAGQVVMAVQTPDDLEGCAFEQEIKVALRLGYMNLMGGRTFKPGAPMCAEDFASCISRGITQVGLRASELPKPENRDGEMTRQEAVKLLVTSILSPAEVELIGKRCGGPTLYLSDFFDANAVAPWAEPYYAAAVYKGWIADRYRLSPQAKATREFVGSLLARAFPDPEGFTGLVAYVNSADFRRAQSVQIVADSPVPEVLYPDNIPSFAFVSAPGMVSFCFSLDEAMGRRVGPNPLEVVATGTRKGKGGVWQIVLTEEDAQEVRAANSASLFLRTWRVAIIPVEPEGLQTAMKPEP